MIILEPKLCECDICGQYVKPGNKFINGHNFIGKNNPNFGKKGYWKDKERPDHSIRMTGKDNPMFGKVGVMSGIKRPDLAARTGSKNPMFQVKRPDVSERMKQQKGEKSVWFNKKRLDHSIRMKGENNPAWNGGSSFKNYSPEFNTNFKKYVRNKFNYICVLCGITEEETGKKHLPHHIDYDRKNTKEENFVLLCRSDNGRVNKNRDWWSLYFKLYLMIRGLK